MTCNVVAEMQKKQTSVHCLFPNGASSVLFIWSVHLTLKHIVVAGLIDAKKSRLAIKYPKTSSSAVVVPNA